MKKQIPVPVIVAAIVLILAVAAFFLFQAGNTQTFPAPDVPKEVPKYIYDAMPQAEKDRLTREGYKIVDGPPPAPAEGAPKIQGAPEGASFGGPK